MDTGDLDKIAEEIDGEVQGTVEDVGQEVEAVASEVGRLDWNSFLSVWDNSPFTVVEQMIAGAKKDWEEPIRTSRIVPAVVYPAYWYLAPYLKSGGEELIPEPFRPLAGSLMILAVAIVQQMNAKKNEEVSANEGVGTS